MKAHDACQSFQIETASSFLKHRSHAYRILRRSVTPGILTRAGASTDERTVCIRKPTVG